MIRRRYVVFEQYGQHMVPIGRPYWTVRGAKRAVRRAYARVWRLSLPTSVRAGLRYRVAERA